MKINFDNIKQELGGEITDILIAVSRDEKLARVGKNEIDSIMGPMYVFIMRRMNLDYRLIAAARLVPLSENKLHLSEPMWDADNPVHINNRRLAIDCLNQLFDVSSASEKYRFQIYHGNEFLPYALELQKLFNYSIISNMTT